MDSHEDRSRDAAAQDADATPFVSLESIRDETHGLRRRGLLLAIVLGVLVALVLLAALDYLHRGHPSHP